MMNIKYIFCNFASNASLQRKRDAGKGNCLGSESRPSKRAATLNNREGKDHMTGYYNVI